MLGHLNVDLGQLLDNRVHFIDIADHQLIGLALHQIQLRRQLPKAGGQVFCIPNKAAAKHARGWVGRQIASRAKELIECAVQAHGRAAHDVNHAVGVVDHGLLAGQVAVAVAQVGLNEGVKLALNAVDHHAGAQVGVTNFGHWVGLQHHFLPRVAFGGHVGNVVADRA